MSLGVSQVRAWDPGCLHTTAEAFRRAGREVDRAADSSQSATSAVFAHWLGEAAGRAETHCASAAESARKVADALRRSGDVAADGAERMGAARRHLLGLVDRAEQEGFVVGDDGSVVAPKALVASVTNAIGAVVGAGDEQAARAAARAEREAHDWAVRITEALLDVEQADDATASRLAAVDLPSSVAAKVPAMLATFFPESSSLQTRGRLIDSAAKLSLFAFHGGVGETYEVAQFADGHVEVTQSDSGSLGLDVGPASADLTSGKGSTWVVEGPDAMARARHLMEHMYVAEYPKGAQINTGSPVVHRVGPAPDLTVESSSHGYGWDRGGQVSESTDMSQHASTVTDHRTGEVTRTYASSLSLGAKADLGITGSDVHSGTQHFSVTTGSDDQITQVQLTRTHEHDAGSGLGASAGDRYGGGYDQQHHDGGQTQTVATLKVHGGHERALADAYVRGDSDAGDQLARLMHDHGTVTRTIFSSTGGSRDVDFTIDGLRTDAGDQTTVSHATAGSYLGPADSEGHRHWHSLDLGGDRR